MPAVLTEPFRLRTWRETAWALLALWIGVFWFCVLVTLLATGVGLAITIVGLPILALTLLVATWGARLERGLARGLLLARVDEPPVEHEEGKESWRRVLQLLTSERRWRSVLYLLLLFPIGLVEFLVAVTAWTVALSLLSAPIWWWTVPDADFVWDGNRLDTPWEWALVVVGGVVALLAAPWLVRGCVWVHLALMRALVGPTRRELERAARQAGSERDQAVATASRDRRAIERDLHDGAQARLVALAVDLDRARHRLEDADAEGEALALVRSAQEQAQTALSEIRDLARGVHPAILTNRGLDAALSALAGRSAVPVTLAADLAEPLPGDVEAAAYFVASEALANANRHADATEIRLGARVDRDRLVLEIADDGLGGADEALGTGIAGLRERVGALGGTLDLTSVAGSGTTIVARLPCAS
jgi:signal transduction histidine kinase